MMDKIIDVGKTKVGTAFSKFGECFKIGLVIGLKKTYPMIYLVS